MIPPHDGSDDETTVLPPVDDAPELVRPYVQAVESEAAAKRQPTPAPERVAEPDPDAEPGPDAEPEPTPVPEPATAPKADVTPEPPEPVRATAVLPATADVRAPEPPRRGGRKGWALAGGALLLIVAGTGAALLTRPPGNSPAASTSPSRTGASPSASAVPASASTSTSARPTSHRPSPSRSPKSSPTVRPKPTPSPSATRPSPSADPSVSPSGGTPGATLRLGSTGPAVVTLQQDLRALWIDRGLQPSGAYDQRTEQDVASFQVWYGVQGDPSGVYGPNSQAKMAQLMASQGNNGGGGNNGGQPGSAPAQ
jgi:hypothetical protein